MLLVFLLQKKKKELFSIEIRNVTIGQAKKWLHTHKHDKETNNGGTRNETIWGATMVKTLSCLPVYSDANGFCLFVCLPSPRLLSFPNSVQETMREREFLQYERANVY